MIAMQPWMNFACKDFVLDASITIRAVLMDSVVMFLATTTAGAMSMVSEADAVMTTARGFHDYSCGCFDGVFGVCSGDYDKGFACVSVVDASHSTTWALSLTLLFLNLQTLHRGCFLSVG